MQTIVASLDAASFETALRIRPDYPEPHNNLGNLRLAEGRVDEARREYERAVASGPRNAEAHNNLGAALLANGTLRLPGWAQLRRRQIDGIVERLAVATQDDHGSGPAARALRPRPDDA